MTELDTLRGREDHVAATIDALTGLLMYKTGGRRPIVAGRWRRWLDNGATRSEESFAAAALPRQPWRSDASLRSRVAAP